MAGTTHHVSVDLTKCLAEEPGTGHNRWHEAIPPLVTVDPGDTVVLQTRDGFDGRLGPDSTDADVAAVSTARIHPHTGPVAVRGAEPGDLLEVRVQKIRCARWGFTAQVPGFGFLRDFFPEPHMTSWDIAGGYATSPQLPGVRIAGAPFMDSLGGAVDRAARAPGGPGGRAARAWCAVMAPLADSAVPADPRIAAEGLRTIPPRETGGNLDVKQLTAGTTLQGDGEVCGTAIEVAATFTAELHLRKGEATRRQVRSPQFFRDTPEPAVFAPPPRYYATTGLPLHTDGRNESEDASLAAVDALGQMIDYLMVEWGYTRQQAYAICSVAVDLKVSEAVDVPNVVVSAFLPLDIFV
ncbi:acetamidase/formamidase family protein [Pseudonocardia dioxanivorans]|uniref:acetamidase/formamidase family protein n=1 Tax=Pseudonocardia dioxanivorans TaxID=240495 RepID=UPI000CD2A697|nr:acetamidase/formamidase family protein [Pseudonocardia dioxanivorans]